MILWEDLSPAVVVELVNVEECAFKDVPAEFASREGEGDGSLAFWKDTHEEYFKLQLTDWEDRQPPAQRRSVAAVHR